MQVYTFNMISWKKLTLIGLPIIVSGYYFSQGSLPASLEVEETTQFVSSHYSPSSVPKKLLQKDEVKVSQAVEYHQGNLADSNHEVFDPSSDEAEGINWESLNREWHETLKYHLSTLNEEKAEELFNLFMDEKNDFNRTSKHLVQKERSLLILDEAGDMVGVKDQKMLGETTQQLNRLHNSYMSKAKKIFGPYYSSICELRRTFESGIPAQTRILIDAAFAECN